MKKFTLILSLLVAFVTTTMAQISTEKMYYIKNVEQNKYLTVGGTADNAYGEVYGADKTDGNGKQIFTFITATEEGKYYVVSNSGEYISYQGTGAGWNVNADPSIVNAHELTFESTDTENVYRIKCYNSSKGADKYFKFEWVAAGNAYFPYNDAELASAATWTLEEYTLPARTEYVHVDGNMSSSRKLNSFTITDSEHELTVSDIQATNSSAVYVDKTTSKLTTYAGATLWFSAFDWSGSWMHAYAYIDYNKDFYFSSINNNDGSGVGEVVSYNYLDGYDITGATGDENGNAISNTYGSSKAMPAFTLPADLEPGEYRVRIKIDWNNIDADYGASDIKSIGGCQCDFIIVVEAAATNAAVKAQLGALVEQLGVYVNNNAIGTAPGQYSSSEYGSDDVIAMYNNAVNFYNAIDDETSVESIEGYINTINAVLPTFSLNMPVDGKAYTFKNVQKDAPEKTTWIVAGDNTLNLTLTEDEATPFICRKLDNGKYVFVTNGGKYLCWRSSSDGGVKDAYDTSENYLTDVTIAKMSGTTSTVTVDLAYTRCVSVWAYRNTDGDGVLIVKKEAEGTLPTFNTSSGDYYNNDYSSAFIMDEVDYANTPKLNSVGESALITSDLHGKSMATFSAPFATVLPTGVTAYSAKDCGSYLELNAIGEGAIPANTGVILVSDNAGTVTMVPAAGEAEAEITDNALSNSAGAAKEIAAGCYVLSAKNGVAGFYATSAGTIAMNKAYIESASAQSAIEIRLPGTTGVEKVEMKNEKEEIFDLTGRKVNAITAPGIYIVGGKKVLVK